MSDTQWTTEQLEKIPSDILAKMFMDVLQSNAELKRTIELLTEQIRIMKQRQYGRKTESQLFKKIQMQFDLEFNEPEATADSNEKEPGADDVNPRRKK